MRLYFIQTATRTLGLKILPFKQQFIFKFQISAYILRILKITENFKISK